ncbi:hypothetical protein [Pleionea sp. CnH1-48]|uniref:hypothetical protein n=1 Tax=Pleionea sp. CnH1-48 TaxID=2954494 RepID=UPI0020982068|nr:hypothetical protein [Pleionea sp. CnH1-48]MCO7227126.1 hypothetical protein [Pleionea sp. CnH1-48]
MLNLSQPILEAIANKTEFCHLVKIDFTPTPQYFTDCIFDIEYQSNVYQGNGLLLALDPIQNKTELTVGMVKLELSAVDQTLISILLNQSQVNRDITIYRVFLDEGNVIDKPIEIWSGMITDAAIAEGKDAVIRLNAASEWADFKKVIGRRSTTNSQKKLFPDDEGMSFASVAGVEYKWGRN